MPGNKLQGALSKSPSSAGLTRVSPGVYRDAQGNLVRGGGEARQRRPQNLDASNEANYAIEQLGGRGMQNTGISGRIGQQIDPGFTISDGDRQRMLQDGLGRFGPMQTLPEMRQGSIAQMLQTLPKGFNTQPQQQQMTPEQQQARLDFAASIRSPRSMGFHQQRQPGQELQGAGFQLPPEELARRRQMVQYFDAKQNQMPATPMPRGGYRR